MGAVHCCFNSTLESFHIALVASEAVRGVNNVFYAEEKKGNRTREIENCERRLVKSLLLVFAFALITWVNGESVLCLVSVLQ